MNFASSWLFTKIIPRWHGQQNTKIPNITQPNFFVSAFGSLITPLL